MPCKRRRNSYQCVLEFHSGRIVVYRLCLLSFCDIAIRIGWNEIDVFKKVILNVMQDLNELSFIITRGNNGVPNDKTIQEIHYVVFSDGPRFYVKHLHPEAPRKTHVVCFIEYRHTCLAPVVMV
ncbi:hypothetical protein TNCV_1404151 [Trichonephila clavipes]|nr:hypothetical protein TNCV_1404151 [Trichonephila clavipes]